jgi:hypothetical protein
MDMHHRPRLRTTLLLASACLQAGCGQPKPDIDVASAPPTPTSFIQADTSDTTSASHPTLAGAYATEGGWGRLSIEAPAVEGVRFTLETENAGDGCNFSGQVRGRRAVVYEGAMASQCTLDLTSSRRGIAVSTSTADACNAYCGHNGSYRGDYLRLPAACTPDAIAHARERFKQLYDSKDYAQANQALAPVYRGCLPTLPMVDEGGVRNHYALVRHKLHDNAGCLEALDKYRADVARNDEGIVDGMAPTVAEEYLAVVGAARTNLALCGDRRASANR